MSTTSPIVSVRRSCPDAHSCRLSAGTFFNALSYRDVEELLAERGVGVDHSTIARWVRKYAPLMEKNFRRTKRMPSDSWRLDDTYIKVRGQWKYLYRAVDTCGDTIDFLLTAKRDTHAADRFFPQNVRPVKPISSTRTLNTSTHTGVHTSAHR